MVAEKEVSSRNDYGMNNNDFILIWQMASPGRLASARDARSLTYAIKDLEAKLGPIKVNTNKKGDEEVKDLIDLKEEKTDTGDKNVRTEGENVVDKNEETETAAKQVKVEEVPAVKEATANSYSKGRDDQGKGESSSGDEDGKKEFVESAADASASSKESPSKKEESLSSPAQFGGGGK